MTRASLLLLRLSSTQAQPRATSPYRGAWHCAVASWREGGGAVFVRGLGATMGRGALVNATIFLAFEEVMRALDGEQGGAQSAC